MPIRQDRAQDDEGRCQEEMSPSVEINQICKFSGAITPVIEKENYFCGAISYHQSDGRCVTIELRSHFGCSDTHFKELVSTLLAELEAAIHRDSKGFIPVNSGQ